MKVAVFGATGMLGIAVSKELTLFVYDVVTVGREKCDLQFNVGQHKLEKLNLNNVKYVINCIGLISHLINESSVRSRAEAISLNALFPQELAALAEQRGMKVIQIATDCVFSGADGSYAETSNHDATDIYGRSKSIGEVYSPNFMNIRTSIIGKETRGFHSLLEWVIGQPKGAVIPGYTDRNWNGVTTNAFAHVVRGVIEQDLFESGLQHLVPSNVVSKAELVRMISGYFGRNDIIVNDAFSLSPKNLTLSTAYPDKNRRLWSSAGYEEIPTIQRMVRDISS